MADHVPYVDNDISLANRVLAAFLNQVNQWTFWGRRASYATTTGSANAQVLTLETGSLYVAGSEADGDEFIFKAGFTCNAAMTLQVIPPGGANIARAMQIAGVALAGGEVVAGQLYKVNRLSTTWQLSLYKSAISPLTTKGDLWGFSTVSARIPVATDGTILMADSKQTLGVGYKAALTKLIYGFTYANNGGDSIDFSSGGAMDSTGAFWITGAALTKNITTTWVVGNAQGMLDTGVIGNSDYYLWAIARSDTGVVDYLASLSSTAPTMPSSYDFKRLIGWFKRVGATNVAFNTYETEGGGLELIWSVPTLDVALLNTLTTARRTDAVKVPLNFSVTVQLNVDLVDAAGTASVWIYCPDQADTAPSGATAPLANACIPVTSQDLNSEVRIRTSATGTIASRATLATVDRYGLATVGFRWARRN